MHALVKVLATAALVYAFMVLVSQTMLYLMRGRYVFFALMTIATIGTGMAIVVLWLR